VVPVASLLYAHIDQNGYTETGYAGTGLNIAQQNTNSLQSGLGLKAILPFNAVPSVASAFELRAVWLHEFLNTAESVTAAFPDAAAFQAVGPQPARDLADLGAAVRFALPGPGRSFEISYNGLIGAGYTEQVGMLRARFDF
jgi:outer membrane autotransporter protein